MTITKDLVYKKAYTELYEVIKKLSDQELSKIPSNFIENLKNNRDDKYNWEYDDTKKLEEQNFLVETKALIVEMYERYLCPEDKKEFWNNYDRICLNMIEEEKKKEFNPDNIFKKRNNETANIAQKVEENINLPAEIKESFFTKVAKFLKKIIGKQ